MRLCSSRPPSALNRSPERIGSRNGPAYSVDLFTIRTTLLFSLKEENPLTTKKFAIFLNEKFKKNIIQNIKIGVGTGLLFFQSGDP
jgi:hypothetical protein